MRWDDSPFRGVATWREGLFCVPLLTRQDHWRVHRPIARHVQFIVGQIRAKRLHGFTRLSFTGGCRSVGKPGSESLIRAAPPLAVDTGRLAAPSYPELSTQHLALRSHCCRRRPPHPPACGTSPVRDGPAEGARSGSLGDSISEDGKHEPGTNRSLRELRKASRLSLRSRESLEEPDSHGFDSRPLAANVAWYDFLAHQEMQRVQPAYLGHQVIRFGGRAAGCHTCAGRGKGDKGPHRKRR